MGFLNLRGLKDTILGVRNRLSELDKEIFELERKRAELASLPLPYDDFVDWVVCRYDFLGLGYKDQIKREMLGDRSSLSCFFMANNNMRTLEEFNALYSGKCHLSFERPFYDGNTFPMSPHAFFFIFADIIKLGVRKVMDDFIKPQWPRKVGPARAERIPQIEKMENRLAELVSERDQIRAELAAAVQSES